MYKLSCGLGRTPSTKPESTCRRWSEFGCTRSVLVNSIRIHFHTCLGSKVCVLTSLVSTTRVPWVIASKLANFQHPSLDWAKVTLISCENDEYPAPALLYHGPGKTMLHFTVYKLYGGMVIKPTWLDKNENILHFSYDLIHVSSDKIVVETSHPGWM